MFPVSLTSAPAAAAALLTILITARTIGDVLAELALRLHATRTARAAVDQPHAVPTEQLPTEQPAAASRPTATPRWRSSHLKTLSRCAQVALTVAELLSNLL